MKRALRPGTLVYIRPRPRWLPAFVWRRVRRWWPGLHMQDGTPVYVERER